MFQSYLNFCQTFNFKDQDRGLETLSHIVRNQKRIATSIGNEVERQNGSLSFLFLFCLAFLTKFENIIYHSTLRNDRLDGRQDGEHERTVDQIDEEHKNRESKICNMW